MKTIAVIMAMLLCGIGAGYEVGDHVYLVEQKFAGINGDTYIGNITSIEENFICINCTEVSLNAQDTTASMTPPNEICLAKNKIAAIRVF